jgi:hypothetical protein
MERQRSDTGASCRERWRIPTSMHTSTPPFPGLERGPCPSPQDVIQLWLAAADPRKQRSAFAAPRYPARRALDSAAFFFLPA